MKYLILFFLSVPSFLFGQEVTKDSTYITINGGTVRESRVVEYANGLEDPIHGAPETFVNYAARKQAEWTRKTLRIASDARAAMKWQKELTEIRRENADIEAATGISPLDTIMALLAAPFLEAGWVLRQDTANRNVVFSVNASGNFRHKVGNDATKAATLYYGVVHLNNYPATGTDTYLYEKTNGNYSNVSGTIVLRKPGATSNSIQPALQPRENEQPVQVQENPVMVDKDGNIIKPKKKKSKKKQ
jgi:hypothetical protein